MSDFVLLIIMCICYTGGLFGPSLDAGPLSSCLGCRWQVAMVKKVQQPSVSGVAVSLLVSGLTVDILSTFCGVFVVQFVELLMRIFEFEVLLFDCFVYRQNVTCGKHFTRYGHYAGEVEDIKWLCQKLEHLVAV